MMVAMIAGVVFLILLVIACAAGIALLADRLGRAESPAPIDGRAEQAADEQEREQILSEVYGRTEADREKEEHGDKAPVQNDADLDRAWEAIERAESSDDEADGMRLLNAE